MSGPLIAQCTSHAILRTCAKKSRCYDLMLIRSKRQATESILKENGYILHETWKGCQKLLFQRKLQKGTQVRSISSIQNFLSEEIWFSQILSDCNEKAVVHSD